MATYDSGIDRGIHYVSDMIREWEVKNGSQFTLDIPVEFTKKNGEKATRIDRYPIQWMFLREIENRIAGYFKWTMINGEWKKRSQLISMVQDIYNHMVFKTKQQEGIGTDDHKY